MNNERTDVPSSSEGDSPWSKEVAAQVMINFLTGESVDMDQAVEASEYLAREALDLILKIRRTVSGQLTDMSSPRDLECLDVIDRLSGYVELGDGAEQGMPSVAAHLLHCDDCSAAHRALLRTKELEPEWRAFSLSLEAPRKEALVLTKRGWRLVVERLGAIVPNIIKDIQNLESVGSWLFRPTSPQLAGISFPDDSQPPLSLTCSLPNGTATILVDIVPKYVTSEHTRKWELLVNLDPESSTRAISVSLNSGGKQIRGFRSLSPGVPVVFSEDPPGETTFSLSFEWQLGNGEWQVHAIELPMRDDPFEDD